MEVSDAQVWQLVDQRLDEVRRLPYEELCRRARCAPEKDVLEHPSGRFRRSTRLVALPHDRLGIVVRVQADGRRPCAEAGIVITSTGAPAPEWSLRDKPPRQSVRLRRPGHDRRARAVRDAHAHLLPAHLTQVAAITAAIRVGPSDGEPSAGAPGRHRLDEGEEFDGEPCTASERHRGAPR